MGTDIAPGLTLEDGTLVHDADFNALVGNATILPTAISAKTLKSDMSLGDELLINDSGTLKKVTGQQIVAMTTVPAGCMMDYAGSTEPLGWVFCYGQTLSRTTYAALFTAIGIAYGAGDGSTTFAVPDCRGRVTAGDDNMGGTTAGRLTDARCGIDGTVLGAAGGNQDHLLADTNIPAHTHTVPAHTHAGVDHLHYMDHSHNITSHAHFYNEVRSAIPTGLPVQSGGGGLYVVFNQTTGGMSGATNTGTATTPYTGAADRALTTGASAVLTTSNNSGSGTVTAHRNVQPTIIMNKIIKT
jgi:microcystin-dependent protein